MSRVWYELRVRELVSPNHYVKKSKFYEVVGASAAVRIYKKSCRVAHTIMWCEKDRRHLPERFAVQASNLFAEICRERRNQPKSSSESHLEEVLQARESEKNRVIKRRNNDQRKKETTH